VVQWERDFSIGPYRSNVTKYKPDKGKFVPVLDYVPHHEDTFLA